MEKNYNILKKYILYFIVFTLVCIIGISDIFALTNNQSISFYDNNGSSLTAVTTDYYQPTDESSATFTTTANSYGGAVMIQASTPLIQDHIYTLFINVGAANMGGMTELSTKNCIGLGSTYATAINSYVNCNISPRYSQKSGVTTDKGRGLYFTFVANTNGAYILVPYTSHETCYNCYQYSHGFNLEDGGDTTGLTQSQVNNLISNQTTIIQNEISNMQQDISGSIDDMKDSVNENIDKNLNTCRDSVNLLNLTTGLYSNNGISAMVSNGYIILSGTATANSFIDIPTSNYINWQNEKNYTLSAFNSIINNNVTIRMLATGTIDMRLDTINKHRNILYSSGQGIYTNKITIRIQSGTTLSEFSFRPMLEIGSTASEEYEEYGVQICKNKLDEANETSKGILGKIKDLFNLFNSDDIGDSADDGADFINDFNTNTFGLTSIITAPLNLIQSLTSSSCSELRLPLPYLNNKYLILPCMTSIYSQYFGSFFTMYQTITYGIIAYWVIVRIFNQVKDFKNPEHDEIEVVDL